MKRNILLIAAFSLFLLFFLSACTPPPAEKPAQDGEKKTESSDMEDKTRDVPGDDTTATGTMEEDPGKGPEGEGSSKGPGDGDDGMDQIQDESMKEIMEESTGETPDDDTDEKETIGEAEKMTDSDNIFGHYETWPPESVTDEEIEMMKNLVAVMETTKGTIKIRFYPEEAPIHSANFIKLAQDGFYDGLTFHRVIDGFMTQGGDPEGTGRGGPGYTLPAEIKLPHKTGSVAAARIGDQFNPERRSSGSQFYMCHSTKGTSQLNGAYTVFGQIIEGQDVNLDINVTGEGVEPDRIISVKIQPR